MKDQNSVGQKETEFEKWDRAKSLFLESLYKPDSELCYVVSCSGMYGS